jgi:hypothetical protein
MNARQRNSIILPSRKRDSRGNWLKDADVFFYTSKNRPFPLPKKVTIDFVLSKIDEYRNEISEELKRAMIEISDRYRGSTALETSEGRYINKEGVRKAEKHLD